MLKLSNELGGLRVFRWFSLVFRGFHPNHPNLDLLLIKSGPGGIRGVFGGYSRGVRRVFGSNLVGNSWEMSGKIPEKIREKSGKFPGKFRKISGKIPGTLLTGTLF